MRFRASTRRAATALIAAAALVLLAAPGAARAYEITDFQFSLGSAARDFGSSDGDTATPPINPLPGVPMDPNPAPLLAAGAHPYLNMSLSLCSGPKLADRTVECEQPDKDVEGFVMSLPPGLIGNPEAGAKCGRQAFWGMACPADSVVGQITSYTSLQNSVGNVVIRTEPLYNLKPYGAETARFGTSAEVSNNRVFVDTTIGRLRTAVADHGVADYGADAVSFDLPRTAVSGGDPTDLNDVPITIQRVDINLFPTLGNGDVFLTNPTSSGFAVPKVRATTYGGETASATATPFQPTDTPGLDFDPAINLQADSTKAGEPSGYTVDLGFPNSENDPRHQSHLRDAVVLLPEGTSVNPAAAKDLEGCTEAQLDITHDTAVSCPLASAMADLTIDTPLLPAPLPGKLYFAKPTSTAPPTEASPWRVYLYAEGFGLHIKLIGEVSLDQQTGRIKTVFRDQPQAPFTSLKLKLKGGPTAALRNPDDCGTATLEATLTGWSGAVRTPGSSLDISLDGQGAPCGAQRPFAPAASASFSTQQAGAGTKTSFTFTRPDRNQALRSLDIQLPPGLIGSLTSVPLCPAANARAGSCGPESKIGRVRTVVGASDASSIGFPGSIYLTEALAPGDPAGLSVVVPAKAGPVDLGAVVVTSRVTVDPLTATVKVRSGEIPTIFAGVPLPLRRIEVAVDRDGFMVNPTGCDQRPIGVTFQSDQGARTSVSIPYSATGCDALPFSPRLRLIAGDSRDLTRKTDPTKNDVHPKLTAIVTQPSGQANIASSRVVLPWVLRPNVPRIQMPGALCQDDQVARRACPPLSRVGTATAYSPLIPTPLSGPVYIVQQFEESNPLPRLAVFLDGITSVRLAAQNRFVGGTDPRERIRTVNTFEAVPDVPVTYFRLDVDGGKLGLLNNWRDLCQNPDTFDGAFTSQSGRSFAFKRPLEVEGCEPPVSVLRILGAKMTRSGAVRVRVKCTATKRCKGRLTLKTASRVRVSRKRRRARRRTLTLGRKRFSLAAGKRKTVRVRVKKKTLRAIRRMKRVRIRITARVNGQTRRRTVGTKVPRRKRSRRGRRR